LAVAILIGTAFFVTQISGESFGCVVVPAFSSLAVAILIGTAVVVTRGSGDRSKRGEEGERGDECLAEVGASWVPFLALHHHSSAGVAPTHVFILG
jgi:hypothetical protein